MGQPLKQSTQGIVLVGLFNVCGSNSSGYKSLLLQRRRAVCLPAQRGRTAGTWAQRASPAAASSQQVRRQSTTGLGCVSVRVGTEVFVQNQKWSESDDVLSC